MLFHPQLTRMEVVEIGPLTRIVPRAGVISFLQIANELKTPKDETSIVLNFHLERPLEAEAMSWSLSVCVVALLVTVLAAAQSASSTEPAPWWAWGTAPYALEVPTDMAQVCDVIWAQGSTSQPAQFALARAQVCGVQSGTLSGCHCLSVRFRLPSCAAITWPAVGAAPLSLGLFGQHRAHS